MADAIPGIARRPEKKGKDYLLAIGIDDYVHVRPKLDNAVKDVNDFVELMLDRFGFDSDNIRLLRDKEATYEAILDEFKALISKVTPDDNVLIYFSGHGILDEMLDEGYWIPVDAESGKINQYFPNSTLKKILDRINSFHTFIVVDSCFSGALFLEGKNRFVSDAFDYPSRWGLTSGRKTLVSDGKAGHNSPFAAALLEGLKRQEDAINVNALCDFVKMQVPIATNKKQIPVGDQLDVKGHKGGQFIFQPLNNVELAWQAAQVNHTAKAYRLFLDKYPQSTYSEQAWWQIASILQTVEAYDDYLEHFRNGQFADQALQAMRKQADEGAWKKAQRQNTIISFREYENDFPHGLYITQARQKITEFRAAASTAKIVDPVILTPTIPDHMVLIKGTTEPFMMGDVMGDNEYDDETVHPVMLSDFYLSRYALTLGEFKNFIAASGYQTDADKDGGSRIWNGKEWEKKSGVNWQCDTSGKIRPAAEYNHPVIHVSWNDAIAYCNWLSKLEGLKPVYDIQGTVKPDWTANGYRLPSEAEWEYAARERGKKVRFGNGKNIADPKEINFFGLEKSKKPYSIVGEYRSNTVPVGSLKCPNALGLYDMSGNVNEWCWDWFGNYPTALETDPKGPDSGSYRVFRGGSWNVDPQNVRAALRSFNAPDDRVNSIGFRLARTRTL